MYQIKVLYKGEWEMLAMFSYDVSTDIIINTAIAIANDPTVAQDNLKVVDMVDDEILWRLY